MEQKYEGEDSILNSPGEAPKAETSGRKKAVKKKKSSKVNKGGQGCR